MAAKPPAIVDEGAADTPPPAPAPAKPTKRKLIVMGSAAAALLLGGAGGAYAWIGGDSAEATAGHKEATQGAPDTEESASADAQTFVDVPPMVVNLRSADGSARFIKLHFMLVPGPKGDPETLKKDLPLLLDAYQPFLRELRPDDLAGSAAVFRIKEEMLLRATDTLGAGQVKDVLIQDLIQQ